jgi:hypothetical protein
MSNHIWKNSLGVVSSVDDMEKGNAFVSPRPSVAFLSSWMVQLSFALVVAITGIETFLGRPSRMTMALNVSRGGSLGQSNSTMTSTASPTSIGTSPAPKVVGPISHDLAPCASGSGTKVGKRQTRNVERGDPRHCEPTS